jgi:Fic family protein
MNWENPPEIKLNFVEYVEYRHKPEWEIFLNEADKRYFYWNELKFRPNLPLEDPKKVWAILCAHRVFNAKSLELGKHHFSYYITPFIQKDLHEFDLKLIGGLYKDSITPEDRTEFFKNSLIEEAIASSQIEGAATTTDIAREMIKTGRNPRNESEQMIFNNFKAIRAIESRLDEELDMQFILDVHEIMTMKTGAAKYAGSFRECPVYVRDEMDGEIAHTAPESSELTELIQALLDFINKEDEFIHPIIKASILHFMIGYIHPFGDGNGRTARALFYWYLMKKGYNLIKHISISKAILDSRSSYDKAFLKTENDRNDLTYFMMYSMKSLRVAFESLVKYRDRKREEHNKASEVFYQLVKTDLNKRQANLLSYLFLRPKASIKTSEYSKRHDVVRQTAGKDLQDLIDRGVLIGFKDGRDSAFRLVSQDKILELIT